MNTKTKFALGCVVLVWILGSLAVSTLTDRAHKSLADKPTYEFDINGTDSVAVNQ